MLYYKNLSIFYICEVVEKYNTINLNPFLSDKPKFSSKGSTATYSLTKVNTKKQPKDIACIGVSSDGKKLAEGTITLVSKKKKDKKKKEKKPSKSKG